MITLPSVGLTKVSKLVLREVMSINLLIVLNSEFTPNYPI
jgi:hypothetical protein